MMEVWKDIVGFEGIYQISNFGRLKRIKGGSGTRAGRIRKPGKHSSGYQVVNLSVKGIKTPFFVHQLVCTAFHGPSNGRITNHKNGIKNDNVESNLEWSTHRENSQHSVDVLKNGIKSYELVSPYGEVFEIENLAKFCRENGLNAAGFYNVASAGGSYKKWCCMRKDL